MSRQDRTRGQLAGVFMARGEVTCCSPDEYTAFASWLAEKEVPVDTDVDPESGNVTFVAARENEAVSDRDLPMLIALFNDLGSVVMSHAEYDVFADWARHNNVPMHRQVDRKLGKVVVMKRGWGTVEMG